MARIRTIKPEIWMSAQVMNLEHSSRLLFLGLITQADDEGRGSADPRRLKASIFGGDDVTSADVRRWLGEIAGQGLCVVYHDEMHGLLYALPSWKQHQSIDRPRKSAYPVPPETPQSRLPLDEPSPTTRRGPDRTVPDRTVPNRTGPDLGRDTTDDGNETSAADENGGSDDTGTRARASRLPDDFALTAERREVAIREGVDAERTFAKFSDYWRAASGANARKHDWDATWRNWCRNDADRNGASNGTHRDRREPRPSALERVRLANADALDDDRGGTASGESVAGNG